MKLVIIGAHLLRDDIEPLADAVAAGDVWLSGVSVADDQPIGDRDLLLRIARIRAALLDRATFIAIRYGLTVRDDAATRVASYVARWRQLLEEHRDRVEMTLKIAATSPRPRPDRRDFTGGADYLRALHASNAQVPTTFRAAVDARLPAIERRWIPRDNASAEMAALVRRDGVAAVFEAGEALKRDFPEVPFLLSGPWPLEVFADAHQ
jgi:hypothetical protein